MLTNYVQSLSTWYCKMATLKKKRNSKVPNFNNIL